MTFKYKLRWFFLGFVLFLGIGRLMLPQLVKWKVNQVLSELPDYRGHLEGVHLALWRGACALNNLEINHKPGDLGLTIKQLTFDISWVQLFRRAVVADVRVISPRMRLLVAKPAQAVHEVSKNTKDVHKTVVSKTGKSLPDLLANLIPFQVRTLHVEDGTIRLQETGPSIESLQDKDKDTPKYSDDGVKKEKDLEARITDLQVDVKNLTNTPQVSGSLEAEGHIQAKIMETGRFKMDLKLNPTSSTPMFDIDVALTDINLKELNPLFRWQWGVDVSAGTFAMFSEAKAREGGFKGYVKPFLKDLDMHNSDQDVHKKLGARIKEVVVDAATAVFKNSKSDSVAARVPFEGRFDNPQVGIWEAVVTVLRNAFIQALSPKLDRAIRS